MNNTHNKGFTLIELLVVVAIIGILATIVTGSLSNSRTRAQEAKFIAEVSNFRTAMELYYLDNGEYPGSIGFIEGGSYYDNAAFMEYFDLNTFYPNERPDTVTAVYYHAPSVSSSSCSSKGVGDYALFVNMVRSGSEPRAFPGEYLGASSSMYSSSATDRFCVTP